MPDAVLVHALHSLHRMLDGRRFIAGLGTGDRYNRDENLAYGVGFPPADQRAGQLVDCCRRLRDLGVPTVLPVGVGRPDNRIHAPNENIHAADYINTIRLMCRVWERFGAT